MNWHIQFSRYALVGLASNVVGYLFYLALTSLGMGPKFAMSVLYAVGVLQTFVFNKNWSFGFNGAATPALVRYAMIYVLGYVINFLALALLVDHFGLPHQWVMAGLVLFMGQKFWVFRQIPAPDARG